jgi:hypothetical protein
MMVKKLKLDIYYLSKPAAGFAQIMGTDVLGPVPDRLKSKKTAAFCFSEYAQLRFFENSSCTCLVPAGPG